MNNKDLKNLSEAYQNIYEMPGSYNNKTERQKEIDRRAAEGAKDTGITAKIGQAIGDFLNPPRSKSADPTIRQGGSYTGPGGAAVFPKNNNSGNNKPQYKGPGGDPSGSGRGQAQQRSGSTPTQTKPTQTKPTTGSGSGGSGTSSSSSTPAARPSSGSGGSGTSSSSSTPAARPSRPAPVSLGAERRTPTSSELRAAQSARAQAKASGASRIGAEKAAVSAGIANKAPTPKPTPRPNVSGIKSGRLATALSSVKPFKAEEFDAFDLVLAYLVSEGHVETLDEALYVMMEMSEETICGIVEEFIN